jgi:hypothetical protein
MSQNVGLCTAALITLLGLVQPVGAQSGTCPPGTCAKDGGTHAANVKNCAKANCGSKNSAIRAECQAQYGSSHNYNKRTRTGMDVRQCIRQRGGT